MAETLNKTKLNVTIAGVDFKNPLFTASGTFGAGWQFEGFYDVSMLGAITTKGCAISPWPGNPAPRSCDVYGGVLNSIGLQNPGVEGFIEESGAYLEELVSRGGAVICQVVGHSPEEYVKALALFSELAPWASAFELNISCPNIAEGGISLGSTPEGASEVISACREVTTKPLFVKMAPLSITEIARAAEEAGADALTCINSIPAMAININTRRSKVSRPAGGMSGPALHPIAVRMVWEAAKAVSIPIIACGGVTSAEDVIEFMLAGATAVEVGSQNLFEPEAASRILGELEGWLSEQSLESITDLIGAFEE